MFTHKSHEFMIMLDLFRYKSCGTVVPVMTAFSYFQNTRVKGLCLVDKKNIVDLFKKQKILTFKQTNVFQLQIT